MEHPIPLASIGNDAICLFDHKQCIILGAIFSTIEHLVGNQTFGYERFSIAKENNKTFSVNILNILIKNEQINYKYRYFSTISTKNLSKKLICHQENRYNLKTIIFVHSLQTCIHFISPLLLDLM